MVSEYVALVAGARARSALAAAHPALATVLASIDGAAGAPAVPEDVFGVRRAGGGGGAGPPSAPPPPPPPHEHEDPAALRSPRRALRKRPPARYVPPPPHPAGLDPAASLHWHQRAGSLASPPPDGTASIDLLLDAPLSADALLALLADDDAAARFAASLAPRLAAATEAADLVADPEVATLLQPLVGGGGGGGGGGGLRRRPSMPPPPPRPSRSAREGGGGGGGGGDTGAPADRADIDDDRLEAFLGGLSYD